MKKMWKRFLALALAFSMTMSMVQIAFAVEGDPSEKVGKVMSGAFVAANGELGAFNAEAPNIVSTLGGKVTVSKTAKPVACTDGNQFEVTLTVVTQDEISETLTSPDAAVTLVIDLSGSMKYCSQCGNTSQSCEHYRPLGHTFQDNGHNFIGVRDGRCDANVGSNKNYQACGKTEAEHKADGQTRLDAAKVSAIAFLDSLKNNTTANSDDTMPARYVSLVTFATYGNVETDWVDIMTDAGYNAVKNAVNGLSANGGTNLEQGLSKANGQMQKAAVTGVAKENKFTVVLTDGKPTYYGTKPDGDGDSSDKTTCDATVTTANTLKTNSNAIYTVFYP